MGLVNGGVYDWGVDVVGWVVWLLIVGRRWVVTVIPTPDRIDYLVWVDSTVFDYVAPLWRRSVLVLFGVVSHRRAAAMGASDVNANKNG